MKTRRNKPEEWTMDSVGPMEIEFIKRCVRLRLLKSCDSKDDFTEALGKMFREALDAIKALELRHDELISDVRIMTTAMQNFLGVEDGEREEVEIDDGVCMILTDSEATARFLYTFLAVMKQAGNAADPCIQPAGPGDEGGDYNHGLRPGKLYPSKIGVKGEVKNVAEQHVGDRG